MKTWGMETCSFLHASKTESCIWWSNFRLQRMNCFLYLDWMICEWGLARVMLNTMFLLNEASCMLCKQSHVCDGQDSASKEWIILNTSSGCSVNEVYFSLNSTGGEELAVQKLAKQGSEGAQTPLLDKETDAPQVVHPLPLRWFVEPWTLGRSFYDTTKFGIVQYVSFQTCFKDQSRFHCSKWLLKL